MSTELTDRTRDAFGSPTLSSAFDSEAEASRFAETCGYPLTLVWRGWMEASA